MTEEIFLLFLRNLSNSIALMFFLLGRTLHDEDEARLNCPAVVLLNAAVVIVLITGCVKPEF